MPRGSRRPSGPPLGALACALVLVAGCTPAVRSARWASVRELTPALFADRPVFDPALAAGPGGRVALTFVTRDTAGADAWIVVSSDSGAHFSAPQRLNAAAGRVASFPESHPVAAFGPGGTLVVAWSAAHDSARANDDIVARASTDGGATFEPEVILNDDARTRPGGGYHGFVTLDATAAGRVIAAWIDGRGAPAGDDEPFAAQVWSAASDDGGRAWRPNVMVADSACPCCRPALRAANSGLVAVAYRTARDSLRDPRLALSRDGGASFTSDTLLFPDRWKLAACPVSGPAITFSRGGGEVAWTTGATGRDGGGPGVYAIPWRASGTACGPAGARHSLAEPALDPAHPLLATLGAYTLAGVIARPEPGRHALALRTIAPDGRTSAWLFLGANARSAALAGTDAGHAYAAWLEQADGGPRLRLVRVTRG